MKTQYDQVMNEISVWEKCNHRNTVNIFELLYDDEHPFMYLIM